MPQIDDDAAADTFARIERDLRSGRSSRHHQRRLAMTTPAPSPAPAEPERPQIKAIRAAAAATPRGLTSEKILRHAMAARRGFDLTPTESSAAWDQYRRLGRHQTSARA